MRLSTMLTQMGCVFLFVMPPGFAAQSGGPPDFVWIADGLKPYDTFGDTLKPVFDTPLAACKHYHPTSDGVQKGPGIVFDAPYGFMPRESYIYLGYANCNSDSPYLSNYGGKVQKIYLCPLTYRGYDPVWSEFISVGQHGGMVTNLHCPKATPEINVSLRQKEPDSCKAGTLRLGNPIYPMTGTKRETIGTGFVVGGKELQLVYDTAGRPSSRLWNSNFHKSLKPDLTNPSLADPVLAVRGAGIFYGFESASSNGSNFCGSTPVVDDSVVRVIGAYQYKDEKARALETYDASGNLKAIYSPTGEITTTVFSDATTPLTVAPAPGYMIKVNDATGKSISFEYVLPTGQPASTGGILSKITNSAGQSIALGYDAVGNLSTLTWPDAKVKTFLYEDSNNPWALTGIVDENNSRFATWTYAPTGQALTSEHAGGVEKATAVYASGLPSIPTVREEIRATGPVTSVLCRFHEIVSVPSVNLVDANGITSTATIDSSLGYPQLAGLSQPAGSGCAASNKALTFDAKGNIASQDNFKGERTCYVHDVKNQETLRVEGLANTVACSSVTSAGATLPAGARSISTQWHPHWKVPTKVIAPGNITTTVYHQQPDPFNGNTLANCSWTPVLPNGKQVPLVCKQVTQATLASGELDPAVANRTSLYTYDESGRVQTATDSLNRRTTYWYYPSTEFTGLDPNAVGHTLGDLGSIKDAKGFTTIFNSYDKSGRVLQMTDPKGIVTAMTYTPRGWIKTVSVTPPGAAAWVTTYSYDNVGQLIGVQNPDGTSISYTYDAAHRLVGATDARGNSVTYTLDNVGNRIAEQLKDPGGVLQRSMSRSFDALNRVQQLQVQ